MSLSIFDPRVALCNNECLIIFDTNDDTEKIITLPRMEKSVKNIDLNIDSDINPMITTVSFSNDGTYLLVCTNRKQLCLYCGKTLRLLSNRNLTKAASKVCFAPNNDIVVADRAGDVYLFSTDVPAQNGTFLLGHLSMLLDVLVTDDGKYIVTADRDEKLRVSMYPNSYNIVNYCLGHVKFVTNIAQLPHKKNILISAGGDGALLFWDYKTGENIISLNLTKELPKDDVLNFNKVLKDQNFDEDVQDLPVKHIRVVSIDPQSSLIAISFYCTKIILIYEISNNVELNFFCKRLQSIELNSEPLDCILYRHNLWILSTNGILVYEFKDSTFLSHNQLNNRLTNLNDTWKSMSNNLFKQNVFHTLYKKKFDNVQDYLEKKKLRLNNFLE